MAFLDVHQSLTGRRWIGPSDQDSRMAQAMAQQTGHPFALCAVLSRLKVTPDTADAYLNPQLKHLLPDPQSLLDMNTASSRLVNAVKARDSIAVFADYDVDGASSAALLLIWLRELGHSASLYVPDRIDEGYGPNETAMRALATDHDLIICVDCGTLSHGPIAAAQDADVIVLDHHLGGETLPNCSAVVNPNRQDETGALAHLCAAAVVFLCLVNCNRMLRETGSKVPDLMALLDLVALATVADVAPLIGVNRAFVTQGLKVMARRERAGLKALADQAKLDSAPTSYHLGYVLGPRINAGGRVGRADLGARLLSTQDMREAQGLAAELDQYNHERRSIEEEVRAAAFAQAEARGFEAPLVWAAGEGWHPGVVGIVASRLKEATNRPAIVIGLDGDEGKGSGRSLTGIDLGAAIQNLAMNGQLKRGGGHKMAAGLTVETTKLETAMKRLAELLKQQGADQLGPADLKLDGLLMCSGATLELLDLLEQAGPFGAGASGPKYVFANVTLSYAKRVGDTHIKLRFGDGLGKTVDAIGFGAYESDLGAALEHHDGQRFHIAGRLEKNVWQGRTSVQVKLEDAARAS